jgi:hypothetical protein
MIAAYLMDMEQPSTYRRKSRWKVRLKKNADKYLTTAINLTGELLHKVIAILPNYKTRHKHKQRKVRPSIFDETRKKKKKSSVSELLKIMSAIKNESTPYMMVYATHTPQSARNTALHTNFHASSYDIYVDNCASRSITNCMDDFIDTPVRADVRIHGTNGESCRVGDRG